jgi:5-methylcytosine-specific restriction endonuclease McrBC GTP-binding regulatory subunit McrB
MLRAREYPETPHVLILDEMNLSHVERYFADLLSAIESGEPMALHSESRDLGGVPPRLSVPDNLFIIGTVNVDETTYLFSPKVLDRANVIEFRASREEMASYLDHPIDAIMHDDALSDLMNGGARFSMAFAEAARAEPAALAEKEQQRLKAELLLLFDVLARQNAEFGFRVAREVARFMAFYKQLGKEDDWFNAAMDAQVAQKLLPKLNGSRGKLAPVLWSLSLLCREGIRPPVTATGYDTSSAEWRTLQAMLDKAATTDTDDDPASALARTPEPGYPISADKLARMWTALDTNGFVSFAEA